MISIKIKFHNLGLAVFLVLMPFSASMAENPPVPQTKAEALKGLESHLEEQKKLQKSLEITMTGAERQIDSIQGDLVKLGEEMQSTESKLRSLESHVESLNDEKQSLEKRLKKDRRKTARLAMALQRISQIPTEALIARPASPIETVQSGILIQSSIPLIQKEAKVLRDNLQRLQTVTQQLVEDRQELLTSRRSLNEKQNRMSALLAERKSYYSRTKKEHVAVHDHIQKVAAQTRNLGELLQKLKEREEKAKNAPVPVRKAIYQPSPKPKKRPSDNYGGPPRLPASGIVHVGYGDKDEYGAESRGLKIRTRENSLVVAPISGHIKFAGEFGKFGQVIIIEHNDGHHSLIAGLGRLDIKMGQRVTTGEPVGIMGSSLTGEKPVLYYELRQKGRPVNPASKFGGLS